MSTLLTLLNVAPMAGYSVNGERVKALEEWLEAVETLAGAQEGQLGCTGTRIVTLPSFDKLCC